jgi:hypothetical protein
MMTAMDARRSARTLAAAALLLATGTVGAFVALLQALIPMPPLWYLGGIGLATVLAALAVWQARRWFTVTALAVSVLLLGFATFFNFVATRVPHAPSALVVGQPAPNFTLVDAAGREVRLADYRGRKPVVLVFYRGYW